MPDQDDQTFARHVLTLRAGERWTVPNTAYEVGLAADGVLTQSFEADGATSSVVTCQVEVHEDSVRVHTELVAAGETVWFRDLEILVARALAGGEVDLELVRAPYTSVPPRPAR